MKGLQNKQVEWIDESGGLVSKGYGANSGNIQFVTESGQSQRKGAATRTLIRSHARRFPLRHSKGKSSSSEEDEEQEYALQYNEYRAPVPRRRHREILFDGTITDAIDPFDSLAIKKSGHVKTLIHHYDTVFLHTNISVNPKKKWLAYAIGDPALLHATLLHSALHIAFLRKAPPSTDVFFHNGMAIQSINKRLSDKAVSDTTICAIACLANFENLNGSPESAQIHMDGLELLVNRKGGIQALGMIGLCRRLVSWVDLCAAIIAEKVPRFEAKEPSLLAQKTEINTVTASNSWTFFDLDGSNTYMESMIRIYYDLRGLNLLFDDVNPENIEVMDRILLSDKVEEVERRVVMLLQADKGEVSDQSQKYIAFVKVFAYTALLHIYSVLHDLPIDLTIFDVISKRLRTALEVVDIHILQQRLPKMLLWALLMGGMGAAAEEDKRWYVRNMNELCWDLGLYGEDRIQSALAPFFWSDVYHRFLGLPVWFESEEFVASS